MLVHFCLEYFFPVKTIPNLKKKIKVNKLNPTKLDGFLKLIPGAKSVLKKRHILSIQRVSKF